MPEFYIIIARKIFFRILGGTCLPCPRLLRLRPISSVLISTQAVVNECLNVVSCESVSQTVDTNATQPRRPLALHRPWPILSCFHSSQLDGNESPAQLLATYRYALVHETTVSLLRSDHK